MKLKANRPIGIFDSGIGGLTVANAIKEKLPCEEIIYFGDTAHLPYGEKSADSIKYYCIRIAQFLLEKNCKAIVIACNTASAHAFETVKDFVGDRALVFNVIDPVVDTVAQKGFKKVGVIATKGTVKSDIYNKKITLINSEMEVASLATPLLVPMIEEGFFNNKISQAVINSYLTKSKLKKIDALILACTHFPLIKNEIEAYYKEAVAIIDSAEIVANHVQECLQATKLLSKASKPKHQFFVSDYTASFQQSAKHFFKTKISLEEMNFWK